MVRPPTVRQEFPVQIDNAVSKYVTCLENEGKPAHVRGLRAHLLAGMQKP